MKKLFSKLVKDLRENFFKQTQKEFAEWLGVSKDVVFAIESGRSDPNASICLQLAGYARTRDERQYFLGLAGFDEQKLSRLLGRPGHNQVRDVEEPGYYRVTEEPEPSPVEEELLRKVLKVLRSRGDIYGPALKHSIVALYKSVEDSGLDQPEEKKKTGSH